MRKLYALNQKERLKSRKRIGQLFGKGKSFVVTPFRIHYLMSSPTSRSQASVQMAAAVSSKNFKKAVDRNRIKRLIRESYRLQKLPLQDTLKELKMQLDLFIVYTGKEIPDYRLVFDKINSALVKLDKIIRVT